MTQLVRSDRGAFTTEWTDDRCLDLVGRVAHHQSAEAPERLSMRAFNALLAGPDADDLGAAGAPSAEAIHQRFNKRAAGRLTWRQIVELGLRSPADRTMQLAAAGRAEAADHLSERHVVFALCRVAAVLGVETLAPHEYMAGRAELVRADGRRGGLLKTLLPTEGQIVVRCGDWRTALDIAGLKPQPRREPRRRRRPARASLPLPEAIVLFCVVNGRFPGGLVLRRFAEKCSFALAEVKDYGAALDDAAGLLEAHGLPVPTERPSSGGHSVRGWQYPLGGVPGSPRRGGHHGAFYTRQHCVVALRIWDLQLDGGAKRSQEAYLRWQVGTSWPAANVFAQYDGLTALRAEAQRTNAAALAESADRAGLLAELEARAAVLLAEAEARAVSSAPDFDLAAAIAAVRDAPRGVGSAGTKRERLATTPRPARAARERPPRPKPAPAGPRRKPGPKPRPKAPPAPRRRRIAVEDLLRAGLLDRAETLIASYRDVRYEATLNEDGTVTVNGFGTASSVSAAGRLIVGRQQDGWIFWGVVRDGQWTPLKNLADLYRARGAASADTSSSGPSRG